ncbi:MAG: hypothetical protein Kow0042_08980 [Calditrichia bacterium]
MSDAQKAPGKILVVDDAPFITIVYERILTKAGHKVYTSKNGAEAIWYALSILPDVIILDIMMPTMDGIKTLLFLRQMKSTREIPIVIVTSMADKATLMKAVEMGVNDFIAKPFKSRVLQEKLEALMAKSPRARDAQPESTPLDEIPIPDPGKTKNSLGSLFKNLQEVFIFLVEQVANQDKEELRKSLQKLGEQSERFGLNSLKKIIQELYQVIGREDWNRAIELLEKLFLLIRELRLKIQTVQAGRSR